MRNEKEIFEKIYEKPGAVWTRTEPTPELKELVETGKIKPCKAIDIGCGEGFYSIYLASEGFDVTGIDFSEKAIQYAKENAKKQGVNVRFIAMDLKNLDELKEKFNFVLELGVMHHVMLEQRQKHVENVNKLLSPGGNYLSVCFNIESPDFGGKREKLRKSPLGTIVYYSSQEELKQLFEQHFKILETKIVEMRGGKNSIPHIGNYFFMKK